MVQVHTPGGLRRVLRPKQQELAEQFFGSSLWPTERVPEEPNIRPGCHPGSF